jgi:phosphatidylinositol-3-phosphatase
MRLRRPAAVPALAAVAALAVAAVLVSATASAGAGRGATGRAHSGATIARPPLPSYVPPVKHVFVINFENEGYDETWGPDSEAPYLAKHLRRMGVLLNYYYATAHNSLPNYIAQISGQAPDQSTQFDCQGYFDFVATAPIDSSGQAVGDGCVYPQAVPTLPRQLTSAGLSWSGYMQQMPKPCSHPPLNSHDPTQHATAHHNYAVRHDPFMYFHSIVDNPTYCAHHVVQLKKLTRRLQHVRTTPRLVYITPDLCADGHDSPCANGKPGGLVRFNEFLQTWAPRILSSPAFGKDGMLVITADESDSAATDSSACCNEQTGPNTTEPGLAGPGGGVVGALVISHWTKPDTWSTTPYNHYSLLASLEELYRLPKIGMAAQPGLPVFGLDVYNNGWWNR